MTPPENTTADVAVVGAGPAGLSAACAAAESGLHVVLIDAGQQPGGQYWRHPDEAGPAPTPVGHHGWMRYRRTRQRIDDLVAGEQIRYLPQRQVWFVEPGRLGAPYRLRLRGSVSDDDPVGPATVAARSLIICAGSYDRQLPISGWDLPGVLTAGGAQTLLQGYRTAPGRRVLVAGTGPFLLPVAAALAAAGTTVVAVCEANHPRTRLPLLPAIARMPSKAIEALSYMTQLSRHRIPYLQSTVVTQIHGGDQVTGATVAPTNRVGEVRGDGLRLDVDVVALGWGFTPSLELVFAVEAETRVDLDGSLVGWVDGSQRSSAPNVYLAGEVTGVGGAVLAELEGRLAGLVAAVAAGHSPDADLSALRRGIARHRRFAAALHRSHPVPPAWTSWLTDTTVICRCEEVDVAQIVDARDQLGADDVRTVKLLTRTGMGWCQGRVCGYPASCLAHGPHGSPSLADLRSMAKRPLCVPVSLDELGTAETPR